MSTLFAIKTGGEYFNIALRSSGDSVGEVSIEWVNELAPLLPNNRRVYPLDNSSQGVFTIGDLKKLRGNKYEG